MPRAKKKQITLIYPHQLFESHPALSVTKDIYLIEDGRFFTDFKFHKKKLLFHKASILAYKKELASSGYRISHVKQGTEDTKTYLTELMSKKTLEDVYVADLSDQKLMWNLQRMCKQHQKRLHIFESPAFLTPDKILSDFFNKRKNFSMRPVSCYFSSIRLEIVYRLIGRYFTLDSS